MKKLSLSQQTDELLQRFERAAKAEKAKNIREGHVPERVLRSNPHVEALYQRSKTLGRNAILDQLGDTDYSSKFKVAKYNVPVSILQFIPDVYRKVSHKLSANWPQNREEHLQRVEFWSGAVNRLTEEVNRLHNLGEKYFGGNLFTHGAPVSGGFYPHWPEELKDRIRFAVTGKQDAQDALNLHLRILHPRKPQKARK